MTMTTAILGMGIIGKTWARNLQEDGITTRCWNRTPQNDMAGIFPTPVEAAEGADFIMIVVAGPPAVQEVLDQILPVLNSGQTVIQSSTISARWSKDFAGQVQATGARFLEAPFTGSKPAAEQRKTIFYLGGDEATVSLATPLLGHLSGHIQHVGPTGSASSLKLAMNLNIAGVAQALCESLALARAEGIDDETYFEALRLNASRSGVSDLKEPKLRDADYAPQFSVKHMAKDLRLAAETAEAAGQQVPVTRQIIDLYNRAESTGLENDDFISLYKLLQ